eukprot:77104-Amphidinium_carterae.1
MGITLVSADCQLQFVPDSGTSTLIRHIMGALVQFERNTLVQRLKAARKRKLQTVTARTLQGHPKVTGKKNRLEGPDGGKIKRALAPWCKSPSLLRGDVSKAQAALAKHGVRTCKNKE